MRALLIFFIVPGSVFLVESEPDPNIRIARNVYPLDWHNQLRDSLSRNVLALLRDKYGHVEYLKDLPFAKVLFFTPE